MEKRLKKRYSMHAPSQTALLLAAVLAISLSSTAIAAQFHPEALRYSKTRQLQESQTLDGTSVTITSVCKSKTYVKGKPQNDYLWNTEHDCFNASAITLSNGLGGISSHATSIGGILIGNDPNATHPDFGDFHYLGAAPAATIKISEFWHFISNLTPDANEIEPDIKEIQTDILTMSVGVVFESWWTRRLELLAAKQGTPIIAAIGNGTDVYDPPYYPAAGANVIGVGVIDSIKNARLSASLNNFSLPKPNHSSCGPTSDGRCGVDIVAPGNCLVPDANSPDGYTAAGNWSSFATPVVAGTLALLTQHAKADPILAPALAKEGGNCVMKAILLNSANKLPYWHKGAATTEDDHEYSLDFLQGAGALNAIAAFDQLTAGPQKTGNVHQKGWDNNTIQKRPDDLKYYRFQIADPNDKFITITLNWNRHYKNEHPYNADLDTDSDLRLELWASDKNKPDSEILLDYSDTINDNIEHIHCQADPNYNTYEIVIFTNDKAPALLADKTQPTERYALAWATTNKQPKKQIEWTDLSGNGKFEPNDVILLMKRMGKNPDTPKGYITGDLNMDGIINKKDIAEMINQI